MFTSTTTNARTGTTNGRATHPMTGRHYFIQTESRDNGLRDLWSDHVWSPDGGLWYSVITPLDAEGKPMLHRRVSTADFSKRAAAFDAAIAAIEADASLDML